METKKITIELTEDQFAKLTNVSAIRNTNNEETARDVLVVFLESICQPIVNLPKFQNAENE